MEDILDRMNLGELKDLLRGGRIWYCQKNFFTQQEYELLESYIDGWVYAEPYIKIRISVLEAVLIDTSKTASAGKAVGRGKVGIPGSSGVAGKTGTSGTAGSAGKSVGAGTNGIPGTVGIVGNTGIAGKAIK
jgi:hypothetical protein